MTIPLIAVKPFTYQGRTYAVGESFQASPIEAAAHVYQKRATFARKDLAVTPASEPPKRRRRYVRKDMQAGD